MYEGQNVCSLAQTVRLIISKFNDTFNLYNYLKMCSLSSLTNYFHTNVMEQISLNLLDEKLFSQKITICSFQI